jgi:hypothetical protein
MPGTVACNPSPGLIKKVTGGIFEASSTVMRVTFRRPPSVPWSYRVLLWSEGGMRSRSICACMLVVEDGEKHSVCVRRSTDFEVFWNVEVGNRRCGPTTCNITSIVGRQLDEDKITEITRVDLLESISLACHDFHGGLE